MRQVSFTLLMLNAARITCHNHIVIRTSLKKLLNPKTSLLLFQSRNIIAKPITKPIPIKNLSIRKLFDFILKTHLYKKTNHKKFIFVSSPIGAPIEFLVYHYWCSIVFVFKSFMVTTTTNALQYSFLLLKFKLIINLTIVDTT